MSASDFRTDAVLAVPHLAACSCALHSRRRFGAALLAGGAAAALPALAQPALPADSGVRGDVGKSSGFTKLVPADQVEQAAAQQYAQMMRGAADQRALGPDNHPQVQRLRAIAQRIIPYAEPWNARARQWRWEVNLLGGKALNAFCMPGGKIAFFHGLLAQLQLDDDEVAAIMGHEVAHALREHARERMGKTAATRIGASVLSAFFGLGGAGDALLNMGGQLLTLKFSREDESEADIVGMELAARAGYDPQAGVTLWQKMLAVNKGAPPPFLSTHPSGATRIQDIEAKLPKVAPIYAGADKPPRRFGPPPKVAAASAPAPSGG
ncbi:MAG: M48 family metallopeptidase [Burkholderiaceae bacterium]|nr:M48 family metallopeptidase [Burkholderiaceae bacterium]